jgi:hypothetical protein
MPSQSLLDDLESHARELSGAKRAVGNQWGGRSKHPSIEENSSDDSVARQRKRKLEKNFQDVKRKTGTQAMQTLVEEEQLNQGPGMGLSMKDFILPTCSLGSGAYPSTMSYPAEFPPLSSYPSQFKSTLPPEVDQPSSANSREDPKKMTPSELFDLGEHISVGGTPHHSGKQKVYDRMSDVSGTILEAIPDTDTQKINPKVSHDHGDQDPLVDVNDHTSRGGRKEGKPPGWFLKGERAEKQPPHQSKGSGRPLSLFGRKKNKSWDENVDFSQISPNKRYRRGERGQLVPRRFARIQSNDDDDDDDDDDSYIASSDDYDDDDDNMDDPSVLLLPGISDDSGKLGISSQKNRPPMLNLNDIEESSSDYYPDQGGEGVETPLPNNPFATAGATDGLPMTYGRGMLYGQDPEGFELQNNGKKQQYQDPPTASEHRRTVLAAKKKNKSALRKK